MTGRLAGKVALISGSARGQGAAEAAIFVDWLKTNNMWAGDA